MYANLIASYFQGPFNVYISKQSGTQETKAWHGKSSYTDDKLLDRYERLWDENEKLREKTE